MAPVQSVWPERNENIYYENLKGQSLCWGKTFLMNHFGN